MIAKRLEKGDIIGIVSPSDPIRERNKEDLARGLKNIKQLGFKTILGENIQSNDPKARASDFNEMFMDKSISAIFATKGGDTAQETLNFVNWEAIKNNPKIFAGISDITVYLNAIHTKTGLTTFHGNDAGYGFGMQFTEYAKNEFKARLMKNLLGKIPANGTRKTIVQGQAEGTLLGGNLRCLLKLKGTEYWPNFDESILLLESYHLTPKDCRSYFSQLNELEVFGKISGVLIGHNFGMQIEHPNEEQMEEIILEFVKDKPILKCNDFGHTIPNTTLPIGAKVRVDATNKKIEIIEDFVK